MKIVSIGSINVLIAATSLLSSGGCTSESDRALLAQATIPRKQAEQTALTKAPGGQIKEGELEKENGRLVWSFDISVPGNKNITEVQVDAQTGDVVSVAQETPSEQAREKKEDAK